MALLTANGIAVASGLLTIPRTGRPTALLVLASIQPLVQRGSAVSVRFESSQEFVMTCTRAGTENGSQHIRVVGGKGNLEARLKARFYEGIPAQLAIFDILNEAGETPGSIDAPEVQIKYTRLAKPAWVELGRVVGLLPDRLWRIQPDGTTFVGRETTATYGETPEVYEAGFGAGCYVLPLTPALRVGERLQARYLGDVRDLGRLERITHKIGPRNQTEVVCV